MTKERRQFSRVQFQSKCKLHFGDKSYEGGLLDISLRGALVHNEENISESSGTACRFEFNLDGTGIILNFDGELAYCKDDQLGIKFGNIDLDSMIHLRRLVELNVGDSGLVQKELFFLITPDAE